MSKQELKLIARIAENLPTAEMDESVIQGWIDNPRALGRALESALCPTLGDTAIIKNFRVWVDETKSVEDLLKEAGIDGCSGFITTKNYPNPEKGWRLERDIAIFGFKSTTSSAQVIHAMFKECYRPAKVWDLLGLAIKEPDSTINCDIVALGSSSGENFNCPYLSGRGSLRRISLRSGNVGWRHEVYKFAAVKI